ncbi:hypothetical protein RSAG8_09855, partial [Rhizoctonia solani AG-8 WAC10335]
MLFSTTSRPQTSNLDSNDSPGHGEKALVALGRLCNINSVPFLMPSAREENNHLSCHSPNRDLPHPFNGMTYQYPESDNMSVFAFDDTAAESFSLDKLNQVVSEYFGAPCTLVKLDQGGYHKVYDVMSNTNSMAQNAVVRVASSAFPRDKLLSGIATLRYIAAHTTIPVPQVYQWNADACNPVGAEYMIMQKVPGIAPYGDRWESLPTETKLNVVKQVAEHLIILFSLRFEKAGSLYLSEDGNSSQFNTGPIVSLPFYRMVDGEVDHPNMPPDVHAALHALRGPFTYASEYLASFLKAMLLKANLLRRDVLGLISSEDPAKTLANAERVARLAVELCHSYSGDATILSSINTPDRPFTLLLDDFRLANLLIDEKTGHVNGYIDFEATTVAPLWQAATVPSWIPDPDGDMANWYGGTP